MSARKSPLLLRVPGVVLRQQRIFRCFYICEECPNEWCDEALVVATGYCPSCDAACEPYSFDEVVESLPEFDLGDE